jgi:hypothetical protein
MLQPIAAAPPARFSRLDGIVHAYVRSMLAVRGIEWLALLVILVIAALGFMVRLDSVVISDMDEGTYIYAGKLLAEGQLPYRDFLLTHPPMIALITGAFQWLFGTDIMAIRLVYLVLVLASTVPLYASASRLANARAAGLVSVAVYLSGMLLLANMGRTVRLEPVMNAFLIGAFACNVLQPNNLRLRVLAGALFGLAILVKLVAVVPIALLVLGDLVWSRPGRRFIRDWAVTAAGAALILVPAALILLAEPRFIDDVVLAQLGRPGLPLQIRLAYLQQNVLRYPLIPVALVASVWLMLRSRDARLKIVSLLALGSTVTLVFAFKTYYGYYIVQVLPWLAVVVAVAACPIVWRIAGLWARPLLLVGTLVLAGVVPALYGEVYHRTAHDHVSSPARIVPLLRGGEGYVYSMYPAFALWSEREPYPWYYTADSLISRITQRIGDEDFLQVFSGSTALVLWPQEIAEYPKAQAYVARHFTIAHEDSYYTVWIRSTDDADLMPAASTTVTDHRSLVDGEKK